jgi:hypothetical protein
MHKYELVQIAYKYFNLLKHFIHTILKVYGSLRYMVKIKTKFQINM